MYRYNIFRRLAKKTKIAKKRALIIVSILIIVTLAFAGWLSINTGPYSDDSTIQRVNIRQGMSVEAVADMLFQKKLIRDPLAFTFWSRITGSTIQAGEHSLAPSYSAAHIISILGKVNSNEISVTIPPGLTLEDLRGVFRDYGWTDSEITIAYNADYNSPILNGKPFGTSLEGYIYPDTYNVFISDGLPKLIQKAIDNMYEKIMINNIWVSTDVSGMSFYDTVILASIVQKEVGDPLEQKKVAGVFLNRLESGMALGSDVTFQYAFNNNLCFINGPSCDSEYNTRLFPGLPPGPISNVDFNAIDAVIHPTRTGYYYFLAGDDGQIYYAVTDDQHQQNIYNYCQENCN